MFNRNSTVNSFHKTNIGPAAACRQSIALIYMATLLLVNTGQPQRNVVIFKKKKKKKKKRIIIN